MRKKFEYKMIRFEAVEGLGAIRDHFNVIGQEGWEAVWIQEVLLNGEACLVAMAKREIVDEPVNEVPTE